MEREKSWLAYFLILLEGTFNLAKFAADLRDANKLFSYILIHISGA